MFRSLRSYAGWLGPLALALTFFVPLGSHAAGCTSGTLIKGSAAAVYYCGADGKRYVFPNLKTYNTWYSDFSTVETVSDSVLGNIPIGGNVTYRPGVRLVKVTTDPTVYAVSADGVLHAIASEAVAAQLYGSSWNKMVDDIPDAFFVNYSVGTELTDGSQYSRETETGDATSINEDKGMASSHLSYAIVGTDVTTFYGAAGTIATPAEGAAFYGQDATYRLDPPSYTDNGDGTVTDNVTGLMWQKDMGQKMTLAQAQAEASSSDLGGHGDWRVANVKELFSLIDYSGQVMGNTPVTPFIDTTYFDQPSGGTGTQTGDRPIDAQTLSSTPSVALTMGGDSSIFGVNFVDGHVKAYPTIDRATGQDNLKYYRLVRGNTDYGVNAFKAADDGTVTDAATGLMWQQDDSGQGMDWQDALAYCEGLTLAGHDDWRLPSAKELESIVDYSRSPETTNSPAIDPVFRTTQITDPDGTADYPYYWSATTFLNGAVAGDQAAYVAFGRSVGKLASGELVDAHGAGAVRSDPKSGNASDYPKYLGPQNDLQRVFNYARCVRTVEN